MYLLINIHQVNDVKSNLAQIGFDVETIQKMVLGLVSRTSSRTSLPFFLFGITGLFNQRTSNAFIPIFQEVKIELIENKQVISQPLIRQLKGNI